MCTAKNGSLTKPRAGANWAVCALLKLPWRLLNRRAPRLDGAWRLGRRRCAALFIPCCSKEDVAMRTYDVSPLYRSTVGFDRVFDLLDHAGRAEPNWPPYDIEKLGETEYRITMAVAGFAPDEIELVQKENSLLVAGQNRGPEEGRQYLHRGIAARAFKQTFNLADHVKVSGARLENGLLTIDLVREVPEAMKPRRIEIGTGHAAPQAISQDNQKQPSEE